MFAIRTQLNGHDINEEAQPQSRIRVWPSTEDVRKYIRHPSGNIGFRATLQESVEWPFDSFTKRRIQDGTVFDHDPNWPPQE